MNPINKLFLYILLLPSGLYRKLGVNVEHLDAILRTKLMMDDRRPNSIHQTRQKKQVKPVRFATLGTMFLSIFLGAFFLMSFAVGKDTVTQFTVYFSFYIFVLASTLISDFTSVLIDVRDNMIILPKPINDKTFVLARLLHIIIHVSKIVIPMTIPGMILVGIKHGFFGLWPFIFLVISATLFTIFLINAVYILILKVTTPQKFKNVISYFQIVFAVIFYGGYQLVPRLMGKAALANYTVETSYWKWFAPSYWFAASWEFMTDFDITAPLITCFLLSVLLPVVSMWIVIRYFAPSFNQKLSMISGSEGGETNAVKTGDKKIVSTTSLYIRTLAEWVTQKGPERMSFLHTWKMTGRSRDFKMKVYPSFGYLIVYIVIMVVNMKNKLSFDEIRNQVGGGKIVFIGILYFSGFMLMMAIRQVMFSDKYKAAWIYYITPIKSPGTLISGAVKSIMTKFYLPIVLVLTVIAVSVVGPKVIPNLILGMCNQLLIISCIAYISNRDLPFSSTQLISAKSGNFIRGLFSLIIPGTLAVLHYFVYSYTPVILLLTVLSAIACWLVLDAIRAKTWNNILLRNYE
jgi:hypothetical protein